MKARLKKMSMKLISKVNRAIDYDELNFNVTIKWENQEGNEETLTYQGSDILDEMDYQYGEMNFFYHINEGLSFQELWSKYVSINNSNWSSIAKASGTICASRA